MLCTDYEAITFNPRSRKGNDKTIHGLNFIVSDFNPRSRKGNDASLVDYPVLHPGFQSTFPQRERLVRLSIAVD